MDHTSPVYLPIYYDPLIVNIHYFLSKCLNVETIHVQKHFQHLPIVQSMKKGHANIKMQGKHESNNFKGIILTLDEGNPVYKCHRCEYTSQ